MTKNDLEHSVQAVLLQALPAFFGHWWVGAIVGSVVFLVREHTQAEYRWIETFGKGLRANLPWWGGLDPRVWDTHSWWWNLLLPSLAVTSIAGVCEMGARLL